MRVPAIAVYRLGTWSRVQVLATFAVRKAHHGQRQLTEKCLMMGRQGSVSREQRDPVSSIHTQEWGE